MTLGAWKSILGRGVTAAVLFAGVGAAINVLVAWGVAVDWRPRLGDPPYDGVRIGTGTWPVPVPPGWPGPMYRLESRGMATWQIGVTAYGPEQSKYSFFQQARKDASVLCTGWPWPSLRRWRISDDPAPMAGPGRTPWRYEWHIARTKRWYPGDRDLVLPLQPVWPEFALGSGVYAMGVGGVWWGAVFVRRVRRRRAGRCVRCGYDLAGLSQTAACPECGRARVRN